MCGRPGHGKVLWPGSLYIYTVWLPSQPIRHKAVCSFHRDTNMHPPCSALDIDNSCAVASQVAMLPVLPTPEECRLCQRHTPSPGINDVTRSLSVRANPSLHDHLSGPGSRLAALLSWFVTRPPNCACGDREQIMNMWGPEGCKENKSTILSWLRESALDNGYPYSEKLISLALDIVISPITNKLPIKS